MLSRSNIAAYDNMGMRAIVKDMEVQWIPRVEVPYFVGANSVKRGEVPMSQQIIDTCTVAAGAAESFWKSILRNTLCGTIHLFIKTTFRMGRKLK